MEMRAVLSFLTRIPVGSTDIEDAARHAYVFPVAGVLIGLIGYLVGCGVFRFFPREVGALFTVLSLYTVTGLVHLDGLSDFSDGVMASGTTQQKISAMKDVKVGIGGIFSVVFVLLTLFCVINQLGGSESGKAIIRGTIPLYSLGRALITSEVSAKLSMNTCIFIGRKMSDGIGSLFIEYSTSSGYVTAVLLALVAGVVVAGLYVIVVATGVLIAVVMVKVAHAHFGGVNGDVIGASNEISRVATLVIWTVVA
jgi:adenosylcobinamide-GDP ribazoletransferase